MRVKKAVYFSMFSIFVLASCKTTQLLFEDEGSIKVIKFMGTVYKYPMAVDKRIFWGATDEHVVYQFPERHYILDDIKNLPQNNGETFRFLTYAFIINTKSSKDTLYADQKLATWRYIKNGKQTFFYDESGEIKESLQNRYSFFSECW